MAGQRWTGKPSSQPPKKKGKRTCGKLELKLPDFPIPEFGGGPHRNGYPIEFKLKAIGYSQSVVEGGRGPGGAIDFTYVTRAPGILDKATLATWI